ncbi:uncharacterized protein METZ01_LOCUS94855 [marine metagenome]|uniref:Uncharacterized protein n=1 Tax=marine metagenome TaxID=408172 RepID=A0A381VPM1_9ZZZZ
MVAKSRYLWLKQARRVRPPVSLRITERNSGGRSSQEIEMIYNIGITHKQEMKK